MLVSFLTVASAYLLLQHACQLMAIIRVILFQQHPSEWPPLFNTPWLSTSLNELWGHRWHQLMRDSFLNLGYQPFMCLFGQMGSLIGAFLISGIFHDLSFERRGYLVVCLGFWVMNGVGVVLERLWKKITGRSADSVWSRIWMLGWLFLWGVPMTNVYAEVGRLGTLSVVGGLEPSLVLVELFRRVIGVASPKLLA